MKELEAVLKDPLLFIPKLTIKDKKGKLVKIKPNGEQIQIIESLTAADGHLVVLKGRQIGSSTIVAAWLFWKWYTSPSPITIAILSHKLASSKHLLEMWFRFYDNLPQPLKRPLTVRNTTSMKLSDTGAECFAISAEGHGGLRSFSANYIHLSEYAFAPNAEELKATALASVNEGFLIQESTANVYGDPHHKDIMRAMKGEGGLKFLFFPWNEHVQYRKLVPKHIEPTEEEALLMEDYSLDMEQIYWRRLMVDQLGIHKFRREYPLSIEEAYGSSSNAYFNPECFQYLESIKIDYADGSLNIIEPAKKEEAYAIGVDVSAGVGKDYSAIFVMAKSTYNVVATWQSNLTSISGVGDVLEHIATMYSGAKILIESNNIGSALLMDMRARGYVNLWRHPDTGGDWQTNSKTKFVIFEELKESLMQGVITKLDVDTVSQLRSFFINDRGNIDYPSNLDNHGDCVIALALALQCIKGVSLPDRSFLPDWVRSQRLARLTKKYSMTSARRY